MRVQLWVAGGGAGGGGVRGVMGERRGEAGSSSV